MWRQTPTGVLLGLRVTPKASADRIGDIGADATGKDFLRVYVRAVPDKGKANEAVIKLFAKHLGIAKSALSIVSGATDRTKTIAIEGDPQALARLMTAHWDKN